MNRISALALLLAFPFGCSRANHCNSIDAHDDATLAAAAGCEVVDGNVSVGGDVTSLAPLRSVTIVTGTVTIAGAARLETLDGLESLRSASYVVVAEDPLLASVQALHDLRRARGVSLIDLPALAGVDGLGGLRSLEGLVVVSTSVRGLAPMGGVRSLGDLVLADDPLLADTAGLDRTARVADLERLPALATLEARLTVAK